MALFLQLGFQGIALGMVYGLIALGFVIMYKGSHTFNFAHGEIVALGAYTVLALMAFMPWGLAFLFAVVIMVVLAVLIEAVFLRRMVGKSVTTVVLATLGISIMLHQAILMIWGVGTHGSAGPVGSGTVTVGSVVLPWSGIATIGTSVVVLAGLAYFFQKTPYGLALRATASHQEAALAQGIDVRRMFALSWGLAAFLAVVAGVFLASFPRVVSPALGIVALLAIPAIVIGGMDSLVGAIIGGLIVGLIQVMGSYYLSDIGGGRLHEVLPYIVMFAVLVVRPYGLFGSKSIERV
ncbi:branched-chain amino acid ABC transporter permease [Rhodococcus sp. IEGM 1366]|uniref:branched-chain amino acid ABC transporter permease n=1 Tax=Rhodococcus sp. IEGM 1366 TaxID=3082223 RepID=UPI0029541937|nr:branched-chain amino acid ABC transporter permease [Rhodococcus sp. IEGM 1366]MDV8068122.1 branched-chain amino acid ABC transporter permease [Rhodococcus sp. IEGM 1366]